MAARRVACGYQAFFRRRRHQARRPPPARIRPGSPAPAMGPGTAAKLIVELALPPPAEEMVYFSVTEKIPVLVGRQGAPPHLAKCICPVGRTRRKWACEHS